MSQQSSIEWTESTWNPVTGCDRVSPGCAHCYALELAPKLRRFARARGSGKWLNVRDGGKSSGPAFGVTLHRAELERPLRWRKPRLVFVNSMSDLFHEEVPDEFIARVWRVMARCQRHTFQVLTKGPERACDLLNDETWARLAGGHPAPLPNVWLGVSIENRRYVHRADLLRATPAAVRFVSAEPLLGPLVRDEVTHRAAGLGHASAFRRWSDSYEGPSLDLTGIDWLIAGGESGPRHRPLDLQWMRDLRDACAQTGTAFFVKQLGGARPGNALDELPEDLRIRDMPRSTCPRCSAPVGTDHDPECAGGTGRDATP